MMQVYLPCPVVGTDLRNLPINAAYDSAWISPRNTRRAYCMVDVTDMRVVHLSCQDLPIIDGECRVSAEIERIDRRTAKAWAKDISVDEYLWRERVLKSRTFSRGLTIHALIDHDVDAGGAGSADSGTILASCESFRVPVRVPGRTELSFGLGIASVYVDEEQRGHGYAAELLGRLHRQFVEQGAALCYLMSEIGPTLYARLGYVTVPLQLRRYPASSQPQSPRVQWLREADLPMATSLFQPPLSDQVSIPATVEQLDWQLARGRFYAKLTGQPFPDEIGARSGNAVAIWEPDYRPDVRRLRVLIFSAPGPGTGGQEVLAAATTMAHQLALPTVEIWESDALAPLLTGGTIQPSDDIPMVLPLAADVRAQDFLDCQRFHWL
jgi:GNAT superfamily N-acetyltransferase